MLHAMRHSRSRKPIGGKAVLEGVEVRKVGDGNGYISVVGHPARARVQKELRNQGTHDAERNAEFAHPALKVGNDRD